MLTIGKLFNKQFSKNILFITHVIISEMVIKVRQKQFYHAIMVYLMMEL